MHYLILVVDTQGDWNMLTASGIFPQETRLCLSGLSSDKKVTLKRETNKP